MSKMELRTCVVGQVMTNCYILKNTETDGIVIVDPGDAPGKISRVIDALQGKPEGILLTHGHFDHILAVQELCGKYNIPVYACKEEEALLSDPSLSMAMSGSGCVIKADRYLVDGETFTVAGFSFQVLHTPGHTAGSCCYYIPEEGVLFSGDTLFCGSVGRTDFPTGSTSEIIQSLYRLLRELPEETKVYPGHESETTIGYEKRYNPFV